MERETAILLIIVAGMGMIATLAIMRRRRHEVEAEGRRRDSPFAVSTEGETRCVECGMGNLVTDATCAACGARLPT